MYAITGVTGQVGGAVARLLLGDGNAVRAVVLDAAKGQTWAARGCQVAVADTTDGSALQSAFAGVGGGCSSYRRCSTRLPAFRRSGR